MKRLLQILIASGMVLLPVVMFAQNVGIGNPTPDPSAVLDITHTDKGLLIPRMTSPGINTISNPAKGLMVYDSSLNELMVNRGTTVSPNWQTAAGNSGWALTGNSGTDTAHNFIGTTDAMPLIFKVNNVRAGYIDQNLRNTSLGIYALSAITAGAENTATGASALASNTTGSYNTAFGVSALTKNTYGTDNTAIGFEALRENISGTTNTAIGFQSLGYNSSGNANTSIGTYALGSNSIGNYNTAVGHYALGLTTEAFYNTAIGYNAGLNFDLGYNNTILGANCGGSFAGQYNIIAIGQGVTCTDNSMARIGNSATTSIGGYADWTNISDGRYKSNVKEDVKGLAFIMKLRPVTYNLNVTALSRRLNENQGKEPSQIMKKAMADKQLVRETGFIAQEVEQAANASGFVFSGVDKPRTDGGLYGLRYSQFVVPLVKAVQEQQQMIDDMTKKLNLLEQQQQALQQQLTRKL